VIESGLVREVAVMNVDRGEEQSLSSSRNETKSERVHLACALSQFEHRKATVVVSRHPIEHSVWKPKALVEACEVRCRGNERRVVRAHSVDLKGRRGAGCRRGEISTGGTRWSPKAETQLLEESWCLGEIDEFDRLLAATKGDRQGQDHRDIFRGG
jgi:hypothetical protein